MTSFNLTLSRWHHVADRLRRMAQTKSNQASATLCLTTIDKVLMEDQKEVLTQRGHTALNELQLSLKCLETVGHIRDVLSKENEKQGIHKILAEINTKKSMIDLYQKFSETDFVTMTSLANINSTIANRRAGESNSFYDKMSVKVRLVELSEIPDFKCKAEQLRSEIASLNDKIADLNVKKVNIELDEALAQVIGLTQ